MKCVAKETFFFDDERLVGRKQSFNLNGESLGSQSLQDDGQE